MKYCLIPIERNERCVEIKYFNKNLFYLKSMARATQNRLACHLGHACHRFASAVLDCLRLTVRLGLVYIWLYAGHRFGSKPFK